MKHEYVNITITDGGLGDLLCELVAVDYNIRNYKHVTFFVWVPDYMVDFAKHVVSSGALIRSYTQGQKKYNEKLPGLSTGWRSFHTPMRTHPVDFGFHMLTDKHIYDLNEKNYLKINPDKIDIKRFSLPEKYVVITCGSIVPVKEMPVKTANEIIDYVISKGYVPVFLGKEKVETGVKDIRIIANLLDINYNKGINLINKTNLLEASKIIHNAKAFIGMDGGLLHLAGSTDTEIICGFTLVNPNHIAPIRNGSQTYKFHAVVPDENIPNRFYQTNMNFNYDEDMRFFNGWQNVVDNITSEKFIERLKVIL